MPTLTVKNLPEPLYLSLKRQAAVNRRSLNSELIICIEKAVGAPRVDAVEFLGAVERLHQSLSVPPLTDAFIEEALDRERI